MQLALDARPYLDIRRTEADYGGPGAENGHTGSGPQDGVQTDRYEVGKHLTQTKNDVKQP